MRHADQIIDRILFLDGLPNLQRLDKLHIGETVKEQLKSDLALEHAPSSASGTGITPLPRQGRPNERGAARDILAAEEKHVDWIETQLGSSRDRGEALAQQLVSPCGCATSADCRGPAARVGYEAVEGAALRPR
jgi:bacterioferritin